MDSFLGQFCSVATEPVLTPALMRCVLRELPLSVIVTDVKRRVVYVNPAFERLCGYSFDELSGESLNGLLHGPGTDTRTVSRMREAANAGRAFHERVLNYRKSGDPYWIDLRVTPILDPSQQVTHFIGIMSEVTDQMVRDHTAPTE